MDGVVVDDARTHDRLPPLRSERRAALSQRRALLHVRRARSGLASRGGVPAAERGVSRTAISQRQGDGAQHAALPRQDSRPALFRSRRPARPDRLARYALLRNSSRPRRARRCSETFRSAVANHGHHPSVCIWTLFNEGWGIDLDDNPDDRRWLIESFDAAKALGPDSLLIDNSPCFPRNYHLKTDIEDFHWYNGFPHQNEAFAATTRAFARAGALGLVAAWRRC